MLARLGRPRTVSDATILSAVAAAVSEVGPARLTLADVAHAAGITAAAVAQRFGSKRNLLLSFVRAANPAEHFLTVYAASSVTDPLDRLVAALVLTTAHADHTPESFANHLAFLHLDLADAEFRAVLAEQEGALLAVLQQHLADAVAHGILAADTDVPALAAAVGALRHGSQISWAISRTGSLASTLSRDLQLLLRPLRIQTRDRRQRCINNSYADTLPSSPEPLAAPAAPSPSNWGAPARPCMPPGAARAPLAPR